ncbi:hypothetical protein BamIOP4010DRAFT_0573 [Burkholderia ambifaria IOP40-10]|uniref:Uncharacterized protein n=1 Tax=Burkholderia ambifaria IOP40-10 TaxID=396596 RepID=B1F964_9BURK|nr:hypothetical protein [Burkholderia ambifaria]EDT05836.1 hypothetical protein BamIOP4010DRAFT_0573 [Burkholderia ambifaria IOP40-10]
MKGRRPLSKAQLLPLPGDQVRRLSLKHHLALTCLAAGQGGTESLSTLSNVIDIARYIDNAHAPEFEKAEAAIDSCVARAERDQKFTLTDPERTAIAAALVLHDAQLARVPFHRYITALEQTALSPRQFAEPAAQKPPKGVLPCSRDCS